MQLQKRKRQVLKEVIRVVEYLSSGKRQKQFFFEIFQSIVQKCTVPNLNALSPKTKHYMFCDKENILR